MLIIIDNTLTAIDHSLPSKEELHMFCQLLLTIGVDIIELSAAVYERMEYLPEKGKYYLNISSADAISTRDLESYPGFCGLISRYTTLDERVIPEIQINDPRELMRLKQMRGCKELRIVGLDGLFRHPYDRIMRDIIKMLSGSSIQFCPENHYNCASALAVLWLSEYGNKITSSFAGLKNNAATEEVIMTMRLSVRRKPNSDLTVLPQLSRLYEKFTGRTISSRKPILGRKIFQVEAGIHADGIMKNPATYEAYDPGWVGQKSELVIGKHSGTKAIRMKLSQMQLPLPDEEKILKILNRVKSFSSAKRASLNDAEFDRIVREVLADEGSKIYS